MASKRAIQSLRPLVNLNSINRLSGTTTSLARTTGILLPRYTQLRTASTATSNLPKETESQIQKDALLSNPDPPSDSASAALIDSHLPYMVATYVRPPPVFTKGQGCYLWDIENRRYIDFTSGIAVNALGHADPELCRIVNDQVKQLVHVSNLYHNPWTGALSRLLVEKTLETGGMKSAQRAFVCNSGSEANEAAIKFSRKAGKVIGGAEKYEIVSFYNSFHGRTMGSLSATPNQKYQAPFAPMLPGFHYGTFNDASSEAINKLITNKTCGVLVEPIQGEGGVHTATIEFLTALRTRCNEVGAVLVYDEIQCGLSRTGTGLWAHSNLPETAHPDIITTAKALGNGFPIGATIVSEDVASKIVTGDHGTTFGGNPLASRIGHYVLGRISTPSFLQSVRSKGDIFKSRLEAMMSKYPDIVKEIRGKGLILGVQLDRDPGKLVGWCRERGLLVITAGKDTVRIVPPLVVGEDVIAEGLDVLEGALGEMSGGRL